MLKALALALEVVEVVQSPLLDLSLTLLLNLCLLRSRKLKTSDNLSAPFFLYLDI
ncbi:hypothetical protein D3C87_1547450 [compost metagenome]